MDQIADDTFIQIYVEERKGINYFSLLFNVIFGHLFIQILLINAKHTNGEVEVIYWMNIFT